VPSGNSLPQKEHFLGFGKDNSSKYSGFHIIF
jgi:hypothetical protein